MKNKNLGAHVILYNDTSILLLKKTYGSQNWTLPGGTINIGEDIEEALIREVNEEVSINLNQDSLEFIDYLYSQSHYSVGFYFCYKLGALELNKAKFNKAEFSNMKLFNFGDLPSDIGEYSKLKIEIWLEKKRILNNL